MLCRRLPHDHRHHITTRYLTVRANSCNGCDLIHYVDGIFFTLSGHGLLKREVRQILMKFHASNYGPQLGDRFSSSKSWTMVCAGGSKTGQERDSKKPLAPIIQYTRQGLGSSFSVSIPPASTIPATKKAYIFVCTWRPAPGSALRQRSLVPTPEPKAPASPPHRIGISHPLRNVNHMGITVEDFWKIWKIWCCETRVSQHPLLLAT